MSSTRFASVSQRPRPHGFTLVELLVVVGVITVLAAITMPVLLKAFSAGHTVKCVNNLSQLVKQSIAYAKDYNMLLLCGGNRNGEHDWNFTGPRRTDEGPVYDGPWDLRWNKDVKYPFWYEALQPYVGPAATMRAAADSYNDRNGTSYNPATTNQTERDRLRNELAKLCGIYTCPAKKQANIGYGYNYAAVYGVSGIWDQNQDPGNPFFPHFQWRTWNKATGLLEVRRAPVMRHHDENDLMVQQAVPVLWYAQNIPASALLNPGRTIAFCDTGWITNDPDPINSPVPAQEWEEDGLSNTTGYVRFPLNDVYVNGAKYKTGRPWRPAPRHKGKVVISNFDGSAKRIPIHDIIGYPYGHPKCLYGNVAKQAPPLSPWQGY